MCYMALEVSPPGTVRVVGRLRGLRIGMFRLPVQRSVVEEPDVEHLEDRWCEKCKRTSRVLYVPGREKRWLRCCGEKA